MYDTVQPTVRHYTVGTPSRLWTFARKTVGDTSYPRNASHYTCDMASEMVLATTVADNIVRVSKQEAKRDEEAMLLRTRLGHASARATLFGPSVAELKGKTKRQRSTPAGYEIRAPSPQSPQIIHADIFFVKGLAFLVAGLQPLGLTMCSYVKNRETTTLRAALQAMLAMAKSRGFGCVELRADGEGGLSALADTVRDDGIR